MARLPVIDPANATGTAKDAFEGPLKGMHLNIFKGMAGSQSGLPAYLGLSGALSNGGFNDQEKEVIALVSAAVNGCDYCTAAHTFIGTKAGLTEEQTVAIRQGESTGDDKLDALASFARTIINTKGFVDNADIEAFKGAGYTDAHIVDTIVALALNYYTNIFNHVNETEIDLPAPPALV
ncbi:MAG: peroxidase-related enzyme [Phycisphaerales bacterium]